MSKRAAAAAPPRASKRLAMTALASRGLTAEGLVSEELWLAISSGEAAVPGPALRLAARSDVLKALAEDAGGLSADSLPALLTQVAEGGTFSAGELLHALRMLGCAHETSPPKHDPTRSWRTLFSTRWFPKLWAVEPSELRALQLAAAYLALPRASSDDILGAVCAQRWANVPEERMCSALGSSDIADSLLVSARRHFDAAMLPLLEYVAPRIPDAAAWDVTRGVPGWKVR